MSRLKPIKDFCYHTTMCDQFNLSTSDHASMKYNFIFSAQDKDAVTVAFLNEIFLEAISRYEKRSNFLFKFLDKSPFKVMFSYGDLNTTRFYKLRALYQFILVELSINSIDTKQLLTINLVKKRAGRVKLFCDCFTEVFHENVETDYCF